MTVTCWKASMRHGVCCQGCLLARCVSFGTLAGNRHDLAGRMIVCFLFCNGEGESCSRSIPDAGNRGTPSYAKKDPCQAKIQTAQDRECYHARLNYRCRERSKSPKTLDHRCARECRSTRAPVKTVSALILEDRSAQVRINWKRCLLSSPPKFPDPRSTSKIF